MVGLLTTPGKEAEPEYASRSPPVRAVQLTATAVLGETDGGAVQLIRKDGPTAGTNPASERATAKSSAGDAQAPAAELHFTFKTTLPEVVVATCRTLSDHRSDLTSRLLVERWSDNVQ